MTEYELWIAETLVQLRCPYCQRTERRDQWSALAGLRVGCPGCGVTSIVPRNAGQTPTQEAT